MDQVKGDKYCIAYDETQAAVTCEGSLMLNGVPAYEPILSLLKKAVDTCQGERLVVDIRELEFLNSSGINMMTKFVMHTSATKQPTFKLTLIAQQRVAWQEKMAINLARLLPTLEPKLE